MPALGLHAVASRRGPAAGAWVAAFSLGLVLALTCRGLVPRSRSERCGVLRRRNAGQTPVAGNRADEVAAAIDPLPPGQSAAHGGWTLAGIRLAWARLERGAAAPAARCRPWGTSLAVVALAGSGLGLLRLLIGLWAVRLCRRRGAAVDDPGLTGPARRAAARYGVSPRRRVARGVRPDHAGHGGLAVARGAAAGRLAVVGRLRAPGGARA